MAEDYENKPLEIGGSAFELIEFSLTRRVRGQQIRGIYGVNVAKVREVVRMPRINPLASRIKGVSGVFELRGVPIPAVNLSVALGDDDCEPNHNQQIIITEFSNRRAGFIVDATRRIRRVSWTKVMPPSADAGTYINGMTLIEENEFLFILDLDRILDNLEGIDHTVATHTANMPHRQKFDPNNPLARVLLVDDSAFIRKGIRSSLTMEGYQVIEASDGVEALEILERSIAAGNGKERFDIMVTDVEMPRMDGMSLTKKVREHPHLKILPILLHTSLSGSNNQAIGRKVGANGYVIKNDINTLCEMIRQTIANKSHAESA